MASKVAADLASSRPQRMLGRYAIFDEIASGGMATVYFGRLVGPVGFSRTVAIKQLHAQYARAPDFVAQFLDEARLTARIRHPNVVSVLDVVARQGELFVVMEYIQGEPMSRLIKLAKEPVPVAIASAMMMQVLLGLHAAHEATSDNGEPLDMVHRDVSPQNVLVGVDGVAHILDFGVAKAASRVHETTENGQVKGKISYMAPEQLRGESLDRRVDIFAAGVVLWELLLRQRLFARDHAGATVAAVMAGEVPRPSSLRADITPEMDDIVLRALAPRPEDRFDTAREMALALENAHPPAGMLRVGAWVEQVAGSSLRQREKTLRAIEESSSVSVVPDQAALTQSLDGRSGDSDPAPSAAGSSAQTGSVSSVASSHDPLARRRWQALLIFGLLAVFALVATLSWLLKPPPAAGPRPELQRRAGLPPTSMAAPPAVPPSAPALAEIEASAPAIPSSGTPAASRAPRGVTSPRPATRPKASPKQPAPAADCSPPFTIEPGGFKRFKPECL